MYLKQNTVHFYIKNNKYMAFKYINEEFLIGGQLGSSDLSGPAQVVSQSAMTWYHTSMNNELPHSPL